jgi:hypothetical protein
MQRHMLRGRAGMLLGDLPEFGHDFELRRLRHHLPGYHQRNRGVQRSGRLQRNVPGQSHAVRNHHVLQHAARRSRGHVSLLHLSVHVRLSWLPQRKLATVFQQHGSAKLRLGLSRLLAAERYRRLRRNTVRELVPGSDAFLPRGPWQAQLWQVGFRIQRFHPDRRLVSVRASA